MMTGPVPTNPPHRYWLSRTRCIRCVRKLMFQKRRSMQCQATRNRASLVLGFVCAGGGHSSEFVAASSVELPRPLGPQSVGKE